MAGCLAARGASRSLLVETLEERRLLSGSVTSTGTVSGGGSGTGGTGVVIPPVQLLGTPVPTTIRTEAGRTYGGTVGRLENVSASGFKLYGSIDWGDGTSSAATVTKISAGLFQFNGKHAYQYGGTYPVTVSVWGGPIPVPGGVTPAFVILGPQINSTAIITGPAAPKPITTSPVVLNLTANKPFSGKVGGFKLNSPAGPGVLSASIDWGDGSASVGTLKKNTDGSYAVTGGHTYIAGGVYSVDVTISSGPPVGPGPQPLFPSRLLGVIHSTATVAPANTGPDGTATLKNGILTVTGTNGVDSIDITQTNSGIVFPLATTNSAGSSTGSPGTGGGGIIIDPPPFDQVVVKINGHVHTFSAFGITAVTVDGLGGDDNIDLHGQPLPQIIPLATTGVAIFPFFGSGLRIKATVHGGAGNDTIYGGSSDDTIYGDAGNDNLNGGDGTDTLRGGADNDRLTSSPGNDKAYGGTGDDTAILAVKPAGTVGPFPQVYNFGYIDPDVEHFLAPPVVPVPVV